MEATPEPTWLETTLNRANDNRWAWFPLTSLRPTHQQFVTHDMVISLACCALVPVSIVGGVAIFFYCKWLGLWNSASAIGGVCGFVFPLTGGVTYQYVSAHFWNRRAARLQKSEGLPDQQSATAVLRSDDINNPYRPPIDASVAKNAASARQFPLGSILYVYEILFCHTSLLFYAGYCYWSEINLRQLPYLTADYSVLATIAGLQTLMLLVLTVCLARRQTWLGRRVFFGIKVLLGTMQLMVCSLPWSAEVMESSLSALFPFQTAVVRWFALSGLLISFCGWIQWRQPEFPVAHMFARQTGDER